MRKLIYLLFPLMMLAGSSAFAENFAISYNLDGNYPISYDYGNSIDELKIVEVDDSSGFLYLLGEGENHDGGIAKFNLDTGDQIQSPYLEDDIVGFGVTEDFYKYILNDENQLKLYGQSFQLLDTHQFQDDVTGMAIDKENSIVYVLTDKPEIKKMQMNTDGNVIEVKSMPLPDGSDSLYYQKYYNELIVKADNVLYFINAKFDIYKKIELNLNPNHIIFGNSHIICFHDHGVSWYDYDGKLENAYDVKSSNEINNQQCLKSGDVILTLKNNYKNQVKNIVYVNASGAAQWEHEFQDEVFSVCLSKDESSLFVLTAESDSKQELMKFNLTHNQDEKLWTKKIENLGLKSLMCGESKVFAFTENVTPSTFVWTGAGIAIAVNIAFWVWAVIIP